MFELAQYYFSINSVWTFIYYLIFINIGYFLFWNIGFIAEKAIKIQIDNIIKIFVGYVIYTAVAWLLYKYGYRECIVWMPIVSILFFLSYSGYILISDPAIIILLVKNNLKKIKPLLVIESVLVLYWTGFLHKNSYHVLSSGNNDLYFWGFMSDHVIGLSNIGRINYGIGNNTFLGQVIDCFGVYSWLGLLGRISMKSHSIEAAMLFQLSLLILVAWMIYEISVKLIGVTKKAAFIPVFVFSFNLIWVYIFTNNFLSQLVATFCFLSCIYTIGRSVNYLSKRRAYVFYGFIFYLAFILSYPGLFVPYFAFIFMGIGVFYYFSGRLSIDSSCLKKRSKEILLFVTGMVIGACICADVTLHAVNRFFILSNVMAGWPLSMLDPLNLMGINTFSLHKSITSNWIFYIIITSIIVFNFIRIVIIKKKYSYYEKNYKALYLLAIISLIGYLAVYFIKGVGYQQWKFATYFTLPLLLLVSVTYFAPKLFRCYSNVNYYYYFFSIVVIISAAIYTVKPLYTPKNDYFVLQNIDNNKYNSVTLSLEPYRGVMFAANILGNTHIYSLSDSYFPKIEYNPLFVNKNNPLITTLGSDIASEGIVYKKLSKNLILITQVNNNYIKVSVVPSLGVSEREYDSSGRRWWKCVEREIKFKIQPILYFGNISKTKVHFECSVGYLQTIRLRIMKRDGEIIVYLIKCNNPNRREVFDKVIAVPPVEIDTISMETDGQASQLGRNVSRVAAWNIHNLKITPFTR